MRPFGGLGSKPTSRSLGEATVNALQIKQQKTEGMEREGAASRMPQCAQATRTREEKLERQILGLQEQLRDMRGKASRDLEILARDHREQSTKAFGCFTDKNNELIRANHKLRLEAKQAEAKCLTLTRENQRLKILLNLHKTNILQDVDAAEGGENLSPSSHNTWMGSRRRSSVASGAVKASQSKFWKSKRDSLSMPQLGMLGGIKEGHGSDRESSPSAVSEDDQAHQDIVESFAYKGEEQIDNKLRDGDPDPIDRMAVKVLHEVIDDSQDESAPESEVSGPLNAADTRVQNVFKTDNSINNENSTSSSLGENDLNPTPGPLVTKRKTRQRSTSLSSSESDEEPHESDVSEACESEARRRRRASSVSVNYAEPPLNKKLRQGDPNTFNSGYDTGIKTMTLAEARRLSEVRKRQHSPVPD